MEKPHGYRSLLVYAALAAITVVAFEGVRRNDFVNYDDPAYVQDNPHVNRGLTWDGIRWAFTTPHSGNWHALTWISHMIDCQLFGPEPAGHHIVSMLIHVANALLLLWVLRMATGAFWRSAFAAAAFAVHPFRVESVAWIAERKDVLSGLFFMLCLAAYVRYAERPRAARYLAVFACLALGLLAKPMLVTLPFVLFLMDFWPLGRLAAAPGRPGGDLENRPAEVSARRLVLEKIPLFALSAAACVVTVLVQRSGGAVGSVEVFSIGGRVGNALVAYAAYIFKAVWPVDLAVMYPYPVRGLDWHLPVLAGLFLAAVSAAVVCKARRYPFAAFGWLWYAGTLVPVIGLVQVGQQAMADRYTYLPSIGLYIIAAWTAGELVAGSRLRRIAAAIAAGIVLASMVAITRMQAGYWKDSLSLFGHALDVTVDNFPMEKEYAKELCALGLFDEAVEHFDRAVAIHPRDYEALSYKARVLLQQKQTSEAVELLEKAIRIKPDYPEARFYMGLARRVQGDVPAAVSCFREALRLRPSYGEATAELEKALLDEGKALLAAGRLEDAMERYRQVLALNPKSAAACNDLGAALGRRGKIDEAIENFRRAIDIDGGFADAHCNLAMALYSTGRYAEAAEHADIALRLKPDMERARQLKKAMPP
jgi:tetratricopeptide (TPR) repeat protein